MGHWPFELLKTGYAIWEIMPIFMQILIFCRLPVPIHLLPTGVDWRLQTQCHWQPESYLERLHNSTLLGTFYRLCCLLWRKKCLPILVEAWSKVGLRGYHSAEKIVERPTMKVSGYPTTSAKGQQMAEKERKRAEKKRKKIEIEEVKRKLSLRERKMRK